MRGLPRRYEDTSEAKFYWRTHIWRVFNNMVSNLNPPTASRPVFFFPNQCPIFDYKKGVVLTLPWHHCSRKLSLDWRRQFAGKQSDHRHKKADCEEKEPDEAAMFPLPRPSFLSLGKKEYLAWPSSAAWPPSRR